MAKSKSMKPVTGIEPRGKEDQHDKGETEHVDVKPANPQKTETAPNARRRDQAVDRRQSKTGQESERQR